MKNIKVDFRDFWKELFIADTRDVTLQFIRHFFEINNVSIDIDSKNPDIIFYNVYCRKNGRPCFPHRDIADNKAVKVLYTRENLHAHWYTKTYLPNLDKFDFVLGFEDNFEKNHYKIPYYFITGKLYDETGHDYQVISKNLAENSYNKNKNISLISKNPHRLRLNLINKFKNKDVVVDCPGKVGNNMPSIDDIPFESLTRREKHNDIKRNFLLDYFFNICPENSWARGYTTEKLYHAMISGCIPIYWGCDKLDDGFYNKEKIFLINKDLSNIDSIIDDTVSLLNNRNELLDYVNMNPFGQNILDIVSEQNQKIKGSFQQIIQSI